jgi:hypothetical protein
VLCAGIGILRIEIFQAKSGLPRLGFRLLKWAAPPKVLGPKEKPKASDQVENRQVKVVRSTAPNFVQREGESIEKFGANGHEEVWSTTLEKVFGGAKATLQQFERKYLWI